MFINIVMAYLQKKLLFPVQNKIVEIGFLVLFLDLAPAAKKGEYN